MPGFFFFSEKGMHYFKYTANHSSKLKVLGFLSLFCLGGLGIFIEGESYFP